MNGFFNIHKPAGMSSARVVSVLKRLTGEKRIGHAGTLDPEAAGVLPIMVGRATRLFDYLVDKEKTYETVCAFGTATDTQDATGVPVEQGENYPDFSRIRAEIPALVGDIRQRPGMYSAVKVGGERLYALARRGESAEIPERTVHVESIEILGEAPDHGVRLRVACGRGTYIRSICEDLGKLCGCPAHMRSLIRTRSGFFTLEEALTLEEARELAERGSLAERLIPMDVPIRHLPRMDAPSRLEKPVAAGAKLPLDQMRGDPPEEGAVARVYLRDAFWGIALRKGEELVWRAQIPPETGEAARKQAEQPSERDSGACGTPQKQPDRSPEKDIGEEEGNRTPCVLALGTFDGVHRGHQELIRRGLGLARECGARLRVCTFDRHPMEVLCPEKAPRMLLDPEERAKRMAEAGVQDLRVIPFTRETADLEPEEFLRQLRSECSLRAVVAGWNYSFGRGGRGDAELLRQEGKKHGFRVEIVPPVRTAAGEVISSTAIRLKLEQGDVEGAGEMLGCPYLISGPVVKGKQEGARLGFPTANIEAGARKQMPAYGVYACVLESGGKRWQAVANIGLQPTLPSGKVTVEAHVIGESPELYGQRAALYLIRFLRAERRFASLEELTVQIGRDRQEAREALEQADLTIFCLSETGN